MLKKRKVWENRLFRQRAIKLCYEDLPYIAKSSTNKCFGFGVKQRAISMPLASKSDAYSHRSLLSKFARFFEKSTVFKKISQNFICGAGLLIYRLPQGHPAVESEQTLTLGSAHKCSLIGLQSSVGGECAKLVISPIWHMLKKWEKCYFLVYMGTALYECIVILHSQW